MEIEKYIEFGKINSIHNVNVGESVFPFKIHFLKIKEKYPNKTVRQYIMKESSCLEKRMLASLKLVHLDEDILDKTLGILSSSEKLKVELAILLILNVECIALNQFDFYFMEKELLFFKKLFKKLQKKYHKTFIFINSNVSFLFGLVDRVIIKKNKKDYFIIDNPTFYESELYTVIDKPAIVDFVNFLNEKGKKILPYTDLNELLKAIFREV